MASIITTMIGLTYLLNFIVITKCLNLQTYGIDDSYYSSSIAVYRNRAFLTLPRSVCSNNYTQPTLIEVHWNGDRQYMSVGKRLYFPHDASQNWGNCNCIQNAISVEVETKKGRLWVLDKGSQTCPPKLLTYSLFNNFQLNSYDINDGEDKPEVSFMAVDTYAKRIYVAASNTNEIFVFSFDGSRMMKVAVRKVDGNQLPFSINRLVISKHFVGFYITSDYSHELYRINSTHLMDTKAVGDKVERISAYFVGEKLGPSGGMAMDLENGLNYYSTRDYAILRWNEKYPLTAEHHEVLLQSYQKIPYVSHIFSTQYNEIWALVNPISPNTCQLRHANKTDQLHIVKRRVLKLSKYTKIGRRTSLVFSNKL